MRTVTVVLALLCFGLLLAGTTEKTPENPLFVGEAVVARSDVMMAIIRVYEVMTKEGEKPLATWEERIAWARLYFHVIADLTDSDGRRVVEVVARNDSPTVMGGGRTFRVDLKSGEVVEGTPGR
jgi:hypothetical protein